MSSDVQETPAIYAGLKDKRRYRFSEDQIKQAAKLYLVDRKTNGEIAQLIGAPSEQNVRNLAFRKGWTKKKQRIDAQIEAKSERAVESVLVRVNRELEALAPNALGLLKDSLADATQETGSKRLTELQSAKAALSIVNDVSGRDRESRSASPTLHLHLTGAWSPVRAEVIDVQSAQPVVSTPALHESQ